MPGLSVVTEQLNWRLVIVGSRMDYLQFYLAAGNLVEAQTTARKYLRPGETYILERVKP